MSVVVAVSTFFLVTGGIVGVGLMTTEPASAQYAAVAGPVIR